MTATGSSDEQVTETTSIVDLDEVVDGRPLRASSLVFLVVAAVTMAIDGFDIAVVGFIAPGLGREIGAGPQALVPVLASAYVGMMVGGLTLSVLGDRCGRRPMVLACLLIVALPTLVCATTTSVPVLVVLRFLAGLGLGGLLPNVWALVAEVTPRHVRGRVLVVVTIATPLGIAVCGLVAAVIVPGLGWRSLLVVGGIVPLVVAAVGRRVVPESVKYLHTRPDRGQELAARVAQLRPDLDPGPATSFTHGGAPVRGPAPLTTLFRGDFRVITPLLWVCTLTVQLANSFALTWLPSLLESAGATPSEASLNSSLFALGGVVGGSLLLLVVDRLGVVPLAALFALGAPLVALMVLPGASGVVHSVLIAGAGFCVTGVHIGLSSLIGILYPTEIRSTGAGWAFAASRVGAFLAPVVGGALMASSTDTRLVTVVPAALLFVGAGAAIALAVRSRRRFGSHRAREFAVAPVPPPGGPVHDRCRPDPATTRHDRGGPS